MRKPTIRVFGPDRTQIGLFSRRSGLEASKFGFKKKRHYSNNYLWSENTAQLICTFDFAYACFWFSHAAA